ncbi:MAG: FAD-dependent oxidoreductase [Bdellovibrionota bacterium]
MPKYDLIIIGGGSAGLGVAKAASTENNKKILLIDKDKLSSKTSNASLRIIHGGLRYLQNLDIIRVCESLHAQDNLLKKYNDHIERLLCVMPLNKFGLKSKYPMICGSILYNIISFLITGKSNGAYVGKIKNYKNDIDIIKNKNTYALFWHDALLKSPLSFAETIKDELIKNNVEILENEKVLSIKKDKQDFIVETINNETINNKTRNNKTGNNEARNNKTKNNETSDTQEFSAKYVVNTTGPWLEEIKTSDNLKIYNKNYKWCKAFNIILNKKANFKEAVGVFGEDNRAFFIVPRDGFICVGTWYVPFSGDLENIAPSKDEVQAFMSSFNKVDLNVKITLDNIKELEAGILPMKKVGKAGPVLYGLEKISINDNYVRVLSTKYTTFLSQGKKVKKLIK